MVLRQDQQERVGQQPVDFEVLVEVETVSRLREDQGRLELPGPQPPQQYGKLALAE